jgi:translocation protein SEC63
MHIFRLTDEDTRKNYEEYGHPDGKQSYSMGIALPKWLVEGSNSYITLAFYGLLFGIFLPTHIVSNASQLLQIRP